MFITVTPLGQPPLILNFHWVTSFQYDEKKEATAIVFVSADGKSRTWYVEESVEDISDLLALEGQYQELPLDWSGEIDGETGLAKEATGMISPSSTALACVAFGEYLVEVRYEKQTNSIRPFLYSPIENKYLAGAIDANVGNLAALVRELGHVLSQRILDEDDLGVGETPKDRSPDSEQTDVKPRSNGRKSKIRLVKNDDSPSLS